VYKNFEERLLERTAEFYQAEVNEIIGCNSCYEYSKILKNRIKGEEDRCLNYLVESTRGPLVQTVIEAMIDPHAETLINMESGLGYMIRTNQYAQIKLLYELFSKSNIAIDSFERFIVNEVKTSGFRHVRTIGQVSNANEGAAFIEELV